MWVGIGEDKPLGNIFETVCKNQSWSRSLHDSNEHTCHDICRATWHWHLPCSVCLKGVIKSLVDFERLRPSWCKSEIEDEMRLRRLMVLLLHWILPSRGSSSTAGWEISEIICVLVWGRPCKKGTTFIIPPLHLSAASCDVRHWYSGALAIMAGDAIQSTGAKVCGRCMPMDLFGVGVCVWVAVGTASLYLCNSRPCLWRVSHASPFWTLIVLGPSSVWPGIGCLWIGAKHQE